MSQPIKRRSATELLWGAVLAVTVFSLAYFAETSQASGQTRERVVYFNLADLSRSERRAIQIGMAASGEYLGLFDGNWGPISQRALEAYAARYFERTTSSDEIVASAAAAAAAFIDDYGYQDVRFDEAGATLLVPLGAVRRQEAEPSEVRWSSPDGGMAIAFKHGGLPRDLHDGYAAEHPDIEPYIVRRRDRWVTVRNRADKTGLYIRSDRVGGGWATMLFVTSDPKYVPLGRVVASGFYVGKRRGWLSVERASFDLAAETSN